MRTLHFLLANTFLFSRKARQVRVLHEEELPILQVRKVKNAVFNRSVKRGGQVSSLETRSSRTLDFTKGLGDREPGLTPKNLSEFLAPETAESLCP
jgi:hypothetical protein